METEYDRLTRRSFDALRRLNAAQSAYDNPGEGGGGTAIALLRHRRDLAMRDYLAIEAERKRAEAPPPPPLEPERPEPAEGSA